MLILGVKGGGGWHNAAVALVDTTSEHVVFAAEEERYSGIKQEARFPLGAIDGMLRETGVEENSIGYVAYPMDVQQLSGSGKSQLEGVFLELHRRFPQAQVVSCRHHLCHAASAVFCSGWEETAYMTVDGSGEQETMTVGVRRGRMLEQQSSVSLPHSLGIVYLMFCKYLGFLGAAPEGKVMAMAAYGTPRFLPLFREYIRVEPGSCRFSVSPPYVLRGDNAVFSGEFGCMVGPPRRRDSDPFLPHHYDLAASLQARVEEVLVEIAREVYWKTGMSKLCLAGGVALNCVANSRILEETPFSEVFVQPAAHDAGSALGAALLVKSRLPGGGERETVFDSAFLGESWTGEQVARILVENGYRGDRWTPTVLASVLVEGKVIGWFQGRAEFGPRALGARSILADPRDPEIAKRVSQVIKGREAFRPVAPIVLAEYASRYFTMGSSPYMTFAPAVYPSRRAEIAGVVHVDGTARIQTIRREENPELASVIEVFYRRTGVPMLINTSFNVAGEAIVHSPEDAIRCAVASGLDGLVLEEWVIWFPKDQKGVVDDAYFAARRAGYDARYGEEHERIADAMGVSQ